MTVWVTLGGFGPAVNGSLLAVEATGGPHLAVNSVGKRADPRAGPVKPGIEVWGREAIQDLGGTSNNPPHRRRPVLSSLTFLDCGFLRDDEPGWLDVPLHGCC